MMTRREVSTSLGVALAAVLSGNTGALIDGETLPARQNPQGHMPNAPSARVNMLMQKPLGEVADPEVNMLILNVAPGAVSAPHKHPGPVFAYILEGRIENQVDPDEPKTYGVGDFFYEPPMHIHRLLRNLSETESAKVLIFEIGPKGKPLAIGAK